ncbi:hypothetical protein Agub_g4334, partial [Astrephomene gubernaculifera]
MAATVPSHKVIPGTGGTIVVDAFRYAHPGIKAYFLTHAHSDHYTGLSESWSAGPVYCSPVTARLAAHLCGVAPAWLHPLQLGTPHVVAGVEVTLVDANHCPGAVQLLFRLPGSGSRYLHCGDMRFSPAMTRCPLLAGWRGCEGVFADTTYCHPRHAFPTQEEAVDYVVRSLGAMLAEDREEGQQAAAEEDEGRQQQQQQHPEASAADTTKGSTAAGAERTAAVQAARAACGLAL